MSGAEDTRNSMNSYLLSSFSAQSEVPAAGELNTGPSALKISCALGGKVISPSEDSQGERVMQTMIIFALTVHTWTDHELVKPVCIPHCLLLLEQPGELNATFTVSLQPGADMRRKPKTPVGWGVRVGSEVGSGILEKLLLS